MKIETTTQSPATCEADWLILLTVSDETPGSTAAELDAASGGRLTALRERGEFQAEKNETLSLYQVDGIAAANLLLVGVGGADQLNLRTIRQAVLCGLRTCCQRKEQSVAVAVDSAVADSLPADVLAQMFAESATMAATDADIYRRKPARHELTSATLCVSSDVPVDTALQRGQVIGARCSMVKQLVNRTANDLTPEAFATFAATEAANAGVEVEVLHQDRLEEERMGALLAVAQGSVLPPRLVRLTYNGTDSGTEYAIVGKGVTFDSGGYSIKPSDSMVSMKADMAGAATALGAVLAAAELKLPIRLNVYLGLVENMISGSAYRLGDVITARNGTTIEIHNTDAEGRLVMADALAYAVDNGAEKLIDMATLTGACVVALGEEITGLFAGCESLQADLVAAAEQAGEYFWPMPMHDHFAPLLKSKVADCKNVGPRWGGAVTAAKFLQQFTEGADWVHLDIAGPSWADSATGWQDAGGTADPLRSIVTWLANAAASS